MKSIFATVLVLATIVASSNALIPRQFCTAVCRPEKPVCPAGQKPTGSEGCWGCCVPAGPIPKISPDPPTVCAAVCHEERPVCPEGEAPTGVEGCWGCCVATDTGAA